MPGWSRSGLMSVLFAPASFSPALYAYLPPAPGSACVSISKPRMPARAASLSAGGATRGPPCKVRRQRTGVQLLRERLVRKRQARGDVLLGGGEHGLVRRARQQVEHALRRCLVVRLEGADDLRPHAMLRA
jgi:hypothetical protein